jgi:hypothetical protein
VEERDVGVRNDEDIYEWHSDDDERVGIYSKYDACILHPPYSFLGSPISHSSSRNTQGLIYHTRMISNK